VSLSDAESLLLFVVTRCHCCTVRVRALFCRLVLRLVLRLRLSIRLRLSVCDECCD